MRRAPSSASRALKKHGVSEKVLDAALRDAAA